MMDVGHGGHLEGAMRDVGEEGRSASRGKRVAWMGPGRNGRG